MEEENFEIQQNNPQKCALRKTFLKLITLSLDGKSLELTLISLVTLDF